MGATMSDWDAVCNIIENLSPEDKERARVVSRGTRDALVPEARWGTEYRLLLAECAALKADHDALQARIVVARTMVYVISMLEFVTPAPELIEAIKEVLAILEGESDGNDSGKVHRV